MKPMRRMLIALAALLMLLPCVALGNSWGLLGALFPLFHDVAAYADYYMAESDAQTAKGRPGVVAAFVMESRYHRELFIARRQADGRYAIEARSTPAVSQKKGGDFFLTLEDDSRLTFGEKGLCSYTFEYMPFSAGPEGRWALTDATTTVAVPGSEYEYVSSSLSVTRGEDEWDASYTITTPGQTDARWMTDTIVLWDAPEREGPGMNVFNAALFPQTADEVRALNRIDSMQTQPDMRPSMMAGAKGGGRYAVYTAPDEHSCRMAKGKAEVSLGGDVLLYGAEGEWAMIAYQVSPRTARIGYIHAPELARSAHGLFFASAQATITQETFLTDDPLLSLNPQRTLETGTAVTFLCQWDAYTAYVQTSRDGQTLRGFVPLSALALPEPEEDAELKAALAGTSWRFLAGGSLLGDFLRFEEDGSFMESSFDYDRPLEAEDGRADVDGLYEEDEASRRRGTWTITRGGGALAALADETQAVLTVTREDGTVSRAVIVIDGDVLDLRRGEAGGGYERLTEGVRQERRVNVFEDGDSFGLDAGAFMSFGQADAPDAAAGEAETQWEYARVASLLTDGGIYRNGVGDSEAYRKARGKLDGKKLAVYAAPSKKAARLAGGRASVRFDDSVICMGAQGEWALCAYDVDARRWRMGYIHAPELARTMEESGYALSLGSARGMLTEDTALTDDPFAWSDAQPVRLSAGTEVVGLARWNEEYAYVEARADSKALRGLVPLHALHLPEPEPDEGMTRLLAGTRWALRRGGELAGDVLRFGADGLCTMELFNVDEGQGEADSQMTFAWSVSRYDTALALFWDDAPYMLTLCGGDGSITRMGLAPLGESRLSLIDIEGSGVYERIDGETGK